MFRLDRRGTLRLSLTSSVDTYMFLLDGAGKNGDLVERNDDRDYPDNLNSLITRTLDAGDYTIEATTFYEGTMGDFELGARLMSNDATLSGLDLSAGELIPAFTAGETSYTASVEHTQNTITVTPTANHASATIDGERRRDDERHGERRAFLCSRATTPSTWRSPQRMARSGRTRSGLRGRRVPRRGRPRRRLLRRRHRPTTTTTTTTTTTAPNGWKRA